MTEQRENTKRIAKNTLMLYIRMLFGMLVSLYTSRVILQALGVEDYGIYNVVGGFVAMFSILSGSLSAAISRFLTFELGRGDEIRLKSVFSTSINIHIILSVIVIILCETIGLWFLNNRMNIPFERLEAANIVYQVSVFSFAVGLLSVSYNASIISHEKMNVFAYIGILDIVIRLLIVLFIAYSSFNFDHLVVYSLLLLLNSLFIQLIYYLYCRSYFRECKYRFFVDLSLLKEIFSFAGWNFIGASSAVLRDQGGNILLNLFFGPSLNAVRGISQQVNAAVNSFVGNFMVAINPQITKSYATGNNSYMMSLIFCGARYSYYMLFLLSLPILINTDYILTLWLGNYPDHTVNFVRLVLIFSLIECISNPLITSMLATGKIKKYQIIVGGLQMLNFPLSYLFLINNYQPEIILCVAIFLSISCLIARLILLRRMISLSIKRFYMDVILNIFTISIISSVFPIIYINIFTVEKFSGFCISTLLFILSTSLIIFFIGCNRSERGFIWEKIRNLKYDKNNR